jgi:enoyl-CoA hydratase/carnithine racemase
MTAAAAAGGPPELAFPAPGRAIITLDRARHLNRLHREDLHALLEHFARLADDPTLRVLVLTGKGRAFCAGFNIEELAQSDKADSAQAQKGSSEDPHLFERTVDALEALPVPTIARLNGSVFGGATDLTLACDFRIGVTGMELRMPAARLGLHYYASGLQRYVSRLGLSAAKRLFLRAETLPADELLRLGYLDALVPAAGLDAAVETIASDLLAGAPLALQGMKCSLNEVARGEMKLERLREREAFCAASEDLREGLAAFAARREPRFAGR